MLCTVKTTIYEDRTFTFTVKGETTAQLIRRAAGVDKGSGVPNKTKVAQLSPAQVAQIAATKAADLNAHTPRGRRQHRGAPGPLDGN